VKRALAVALVAGALVVPSAGTTTRSGLFGKVTRGPLTPVCRAETPCYGPAADVTLRFLRHGVVAGRATTAKDGSYRIALTPGMYDVRLTPPSRTRIGRGLEPNVAHVTAGRWTRTDFSIDTGIR
jgi:hypothetical protein